MTRQPLRNRFLRLVARHGYTAGLISGSGSQLMPGGWWRVVSLSWRGRRPYILGLERHRWRSIPHAVRHRHWPNWVPILGVLCGKCYPCPDCGSTGGLLHECREAA